MKKETVSEIIGGIDEKYVAEAAQYAPDSADADKKRPRRFKWVAAAACLALVAAIGFGAFAVAAEAKEYNAAVEFFQGNGLSMEGLSRAEVKAVFRDITTNSFTYSKTAEIIKKAVPGWEIVQATPEELSDAWNENVARYRVRRNGISYRTDYKYVRDEQLGFDVFSKCVLECFKGDELLWTAEFTDFYPVCYSYTEHGALVGGQNWTYSSEDITYTWIACVDENGQILWQSRLEHGFKHEYVKSVLSVGDGVWAVVSVGDFQSLCLSVFDGDGSERSFRERSFRATEMDRYGLYVKNAVPLGDGYIVQLGYFTSSEGTLFVRLDAEGNVVDSFSYQSEDCDYYIVDMIEFGGQVYLSGYAVPKQRDAGGRHEIANVLEYSFSKYKEDEIISDEELTALVRDNYTAVLLLCDPEGGEPQTFYSVNGSLGDLLSVNGEGELEWRVNSVISTFLSPLTSSFTVGGTCRVYSYAFDADGRLIKQTDTGETVPYRR